MIYESILNLAKDNPIHQVTGHHLFSALQENMQRLLLYLAVFSAFNFRLKEVVEPFEILFYKFFGSYYSGVSKISCALFEKIRPG